jgi:hypothetical protein
MSIFWQMLIVFKKPYEKPGENKIALFNEMMASLYLYQSFLLTDF